MEQSIVQKQETQEDTSILKNFIKAMRQFLRALNLTWEEDSIIKDTRDLFENSVLKIQSLQEKIIKSWHKDMEPYYDACVNKNTEVILNANIEYLQKFKMKEKFKEIEDDIESQNNLWEYIIEINKYSRLYNQIPIKIMTKIECMASNLAKNLKSGEKTWKDLDIVSLGESVLEGASSEDISNLMCNMGNIYKAVGGMGAIKDAVGSDIEIPNVPDLTPFIQNARQGTQQNMENEPIQTRNRYKKGWKPKQ